MRAILTTAGALALVASSAAANTLTDPHDAVTPLTAIVETRPVYDDEEGGDANADDPAIWVDRTNRNNSVVLGTLKQGGLDVYSMTGELLQHVDAPAAPSEDAKEGRFNNVDLLQGVHPGHGMNRDVAVVSDRGRDRLRTYFVDARGAKAGDAVLTDVSAAELPRVFAETEADVEEQFTAYGVTMRAGHDAKLYAIASQRHATNLAMVEMLWDGESMTYAKTATLALPASFDLSDGTSWTPCEDPGDEPQVEGMVVDRHHDVLYAAQENVGLWRIPLHGSGFGEPELIEKVREFGQAYTYDAVEEECYLQGEPHPDGGQYIAADAEGVSIAYNLGRSATLFASSQGDDKLVEYTLYPEFAHKETFTVVDSDATDGAQHTDGTAVVDGYMGEQFPHGLIVLQDGEDTPADGDRETTNFKFVPKPLDNNPFPWPNRSK